MKLIATTFLLLPTAIAALAPSSALPKTTARQASSTALNAKAFENELGAQAPLGLFDPLGLIADGDQATFDRLRYVELKHGRISMLAVVGYLTTAAGVRLPGAIDYSGLKFADIPSGFKALEAMPADGITQIFLFITLLEVLVMKDKTGGDFQGDFRNNFIDFGWDKQSDEWKAKKRAIELNNGRAAQMGIFGLMVHDQIGNVQELFPAV